VEAQSPEVAETAFTQRKKKQMKCAASLIDELNHTFNTPFDREDIFTLSPHIDDVLDYAYKHSG